VPRRNRTSSAWQPVGQHPRPRRPRKRTTPDTSDPSHRSPRARKSERGARRRAPRAGGRRRGVFTLVARSRMRRRRRSIAGNRIFPESSNAPRLPYCLTDGPIVDDRPAWMAVTSLSALTASFRFMKPALLQCTIELPVRSARRLLGDTNWVPSRGFYVKILRAGASLVARPRSADERAEWCPSAIDLGRRRGIDSLASQASRMNSASTMSSSTRRSQQESPAHPADAVIRPGSVAADLATVQAALRQMRSPRRSVELRPPWEPRA